MRTLYFAVILALLLISVHRVVATDYLELTMVGDAMAPAILDGDSVTVKICTNGSMIRAGALTSETPGDIIVYCAGAVVPLPQSMFTCGRAISKRFDGTHWAFKTKMDNCTEPDPWEVPEYALIGIVVGITHTKSSSTPETNTQTEYSAPSTEISLEQGSVYEFVIDFAAGMTVGLVFGFVAKKGFRKGWSFRLDFQRFRLDGPTVDVGRGNANAR